MLKTLAKLASAAALAAVALSVPAQASDRGELLRDANRTVSHLRSDPAFGTARTMLQGAEAVYIVPKLVKGGCALLRSARLAADLTLPQRKRASARARGRSA